MTIFKKKPPIEEKLAQIIDALNETENASIRTYYRGMIAAFQYVLELKYEPYESEETIEI